VVFAPDSFKGSVAAGVAAAAIARGWASIRPDDECVLLPMADGGEGTVDAFALAFPTAERRVTPVVGPDDRQVVAEWLLLADGTAVIELANASGLTLLDHPRPFEAHTLGFGQVIAAALDAGATSLLLGIGGSSSTDGGVGALVGLGARFLDENGHDIPLGNRGLAALDRLDLTGLRPPPVGGATVLSDVRSPLLGPVGAAALFGPQKGADVDDIAVLDANLARYAGMVRAHLREATPTLVAPIDGGMSEGLRSEESVRADAPGTGAAGGTGFGLLAWGANLRAGAEAIGDALGMPTALAAADVVITGEGRFDDQTTAGKVPSWLAGLARQTQTRALLVAGVIDAPTDAFDDAVSLSQLAGSREVALGDAEHWLVEAGAALASRWRG
jgi:glycerate kinase